MVDGPTPLFRALPLCLTSVAAMLVTELARCIVHRINLVGGAEAPLITAYAIAVARFGYEIAIVAVGSLLLRERLAIARRWPDFAGLILFGYIYLVLFGLILWM